MPSKKFARLKVVLDTNVLISGIFFTGPPYKILKAWKDQKFQILLSQEILEEYKRVAQEISRKFPSIDIDEILDLVAFYAELVDTSKIKVKTCRDPTDDKFLACALAGGAQVIVSGDKHLLEIAEFHGVEILSPRDFIEKYLRT